MKIANPDRTLGEVMAEQDKRPFGWYDIPTITMAAEVLHPDLVQIDVMDDAGLERLTADLSRAEHYPWRYNVDKGEGDMVRVRAIQQKVHVTETQPARLGSRQWETDPDGYFGGGSGLAPGTTILAGSEHDPRLGPFVDDEDDE